MKNVQLNEQECDVLVQLLDIAVKAVGLNAAQAAITLAGKIKNAPDVEEEAEEEELA